MIVALASIVTLLVIAQLILVGVRSGTNLWRQYGKLFPKVIVPVLVLGLLGLVLFGGVMLWSSIAAINDPEPKQPDSMGRLVMYTVSLAFLFVSMVGVTLIRYALTDVKWLQWLAKRCK